MSGKLPDPLNIHSESGRISAPDPLALFKGSKESNALKPPVPPAPPTQADLGIPPDVVAAADRARQNREAADAAARKRGRRATVVTGNEGVGASPLGVKTLVGS